MTHKSSRNLIIAVGLLTLSTLENLWAQGFEPGCRTLEDEVTCRFEARRLPIQVTHEAHGGFFLATENIGADSAEQAEIISTASKTFTDTSWFTATVYSGSNLSSSVTRFATDLTQTSTANIDVASSTTEPLRLNSTNLTREIPVDFETRLDAYRFASDRDAQREAYLLPANFSHLSRDWLHSTDSPIDGNNIPVGLQMRALGGIRNVTHTEPRKAPIALPVPATFWLFGTALIGFISISRRRIL